MKRAILVSAVLIALVLIAAPALAAAPAGWTRAENGLQITSNDIRVFEYRDRVYCNGDDGLYILGAGPTWTKATTPAGATWAKPVGDYLYAFGVGPDLWWGDGTGWQKVTSTGISGTKLMLPLVVFDGQLYGVIHDGTETTGTFAIYRTPDVGKTTMAWTRVVALGFGDPQNHRLGDLVVFKGKLVAITDATRNGMFGDPSKYLQGIEVWESPTGDANSWSQINEDGFGVTTEVGIPPTKIKVICDFGAAEEYKGYLYVGTKGHFGAEIWRYDGNGKAGWMETTPPTLGVLEGLTTDPTAGPGRVEDMAVFDGRLIVAEGFPTSNLDTYDGSTWTIAVPHYQPGTYTDIGPFEPANDGLTSLAVTGPAGTPANSLWVTTERAAGLSQVWYYHKNAAPVVDAGPDQAASEGSTVSFSGSARDDGPADRLTYSWTFGDGSPAVTGTLTPKHAYGDNGIYTVTLTVRDGEGARGTDTLKVTVRNVAPSVAKGVMDQPNPQFVLPQVHTLTFHGTFRDPGWLDRHMAVWSFGDGQSAAGSLSEENVAPDATGTVTATHAYGAPGTYQVKVTVRDDDGGGATSTVWTVHVADVAEAKSDLAAYIQGLPATAFKNNADNRKNALGNQFSAMDSQIANRAWTGFAAKLQADIRSKADGQVDGNPGDDWITDRTAQQHICMKIDDIVAYVRTLG